MTQTEFIARIMGVFGFPPTDDQLGALQTFAHFLADRRANAVMVLRGSAGTGKTSLAAAMVRTLRSLGQKLMLLAPTGRAAKVFALGSGQPAFTIHRHIYRERAYVGLGGQFSLHENRYRNTLFIVDEASMVSDWPTEGSAFGSGSLLDDLVKYVYSGDNCRLLLIGDRAQLPPVGEEESPALSASVLRGYGLQVYACDLGEVVRQGGESGILFNATRIRSHVTHLEMTRLPRIRFSGFADIVRVSGDELVESLAASYSQVGVDDTIVVTRSNKRANVYNQGIRSTVLDREDALCGGDRLMIVKNYYGLKEAKQGFLANGDRCVVERARHFRDLYGCNFADVWLRFPDYDDCELEATVIMDTLTSEAPSLTHEQSERLYSMVMEDYADLPRKADRLKALKQDKYYNALQVKFAYAVTCHKAQGGQWQHVYVDQGYMTDDMLTPDYIHWLYTAFTRATGKLFLVNWPKSQAEDPVDE